MDDGDVVGDMTLAFSLSALDRLDDPGSVFQDAQQWSRYLGVIDNDRAAVADTVAEHDLQQDLETDDDIWLTMERIRETTATPRHVYVGASVEDRRVATELGWEFVHVTEAAEKADWCLTNGRSKDSMVARLRDTLADRLPPFGDG